MFVELESDYLQNGNKIHMTNKIPQGGESQYRLEWVQYNLALNQTVLNVNLNSVSLPIILWQVCVCCSVYHSCGLTAHQAAGIVLALCIVLKYLVRSHLADRVSSFQSL